MKNAEITMQEQIECNERQINFQKMVMACFDDAAAESAAEMRHELACLEAIHETLLITAGLEQLAAEEYETEDARNG